MPHHDRLRIVEDHAERHPATRVEAVEQTPDQRLDPLVRHEHDVHPARVLESVRREVHRPSTAIGEAHAHLAEIKLGEFARDPFEAHLERGGDRRPDAGELAIHGAQAQRRAVLLQQSADLPRRSVRILEHERLHVRADHVGHARAAELARGCVVAGRDDALADDAPHGADGHPQLRRNLARRHLGAHQLLDGMTIQHPEHPPRASGDRDLTSHRGSANETGKPSGVTDFRDNGCQSLENSHQRAGLEHSAASRHIFVRHLR
jgi:hypothetical protein